jgi:hypothetical protein
MDVSLEAVDKTIRRFSSLDTMKADEYAAWRQVSARERLRAVMDISNDLYGLKVQAPNVRRLQRSLVRIQRR